VSHAERFKDYKLPDETAAIEAHLWDHLMDPYAADASKDVRVWVLGTYNPVLIINEREVEVVEQKSARTNPQFSKWKFRSPQAANQFGEMMLPYATVIGLLG
jgi:hypothetical protein